MDFKDPSRVYWRRKKSHISFEIVSLIKYLAHYYRTKIMLQSNFCMAFNMFVLHLTDLSSYYVRARTIYSSVGGIWVWPEFLWAWAAWRAASSWRRRGTCSSRTRSPAPWSERLWRPCGAASYGHPRPHPPHLPKQRKFVYYLNFFRGSFPCLHSSFLNYYTLILHHISPSKIGFFTSDETGKVFSNVWFQEFSKFT